MRRPSSSAMVRLMCAAMCMRWVCCCSTYCAKRRPPPQRFKAASVRMGFPNRCAMWLPRRRRSTLPIGSGRWERCARRSCTRSGAPSIFERGLSLLIRVVRGALAIFGVAIRLPKQVVRKIPDSSLVSEWMALYGPAALGMPLIPISPASRLVRQSRLCRLQCLVHQRCVMPKSGKIRGFCAWRKSRLSMAVGVLVRHRAPLAFGRWRGVGYPAGRLGRGHGLRVRCLRHEPARGYGSFACGRLRGIVCVRVAGHGLSDPVARRHSADREAVSVV